MLWVWLFPVTTKKLFFKITAPKRQVNFLKTTCEVVSLYYICKLYNWNLWKAILSQAFLKGFARIPCDVKLYGTVRNLIIYFAETFRCSLLLFYKCIALFSLLQMFELLFSRKASQRLFQLIHVWKKHPQKTSKTSKHSLSNLQVLKSPHLVVMN